MTIPADAEAVRANRRAALRRTAVLIKTRTADLDAAIAERDRLLVEYHGERRDGFLSYDEEANETGISKGRVIQIVQPAKKALRKGA